MIQKQCPNLKELSLAGCIGITDISGSFFYPMLIFPNLEDLDVSHCDSLHTLKLEAPSLQTLKARSNPLLQQVHLIRYIAEVDFIESPQVALNHTRPENYLKKSK